MARKARDIPVVFMAYDILEMNGQDLRSAPLAWRRPRLDAIVNTLESPMQPTMAGDLLLPFDDGAGRAKR